jgi:hypothetical protein
MSGPSRPCFAGDLLPGERRFLAAMREVGFGQFEFVQIREGQIVLDPWPTAVRDVKFGADASASEERVTHLECQLKRHVAELFEYTRAVNVGEIRTLEIRHGLPFSMEIELATVKGPGGRP